MWITDKRKAIHRTKGLLLPSMVLRKAGNVSFLGVVTQPGKEKVSLSAKVVRFDSLFSGRVTTLFGILVIILITAHFR